MGKRPAPGGWSWGSGHVCGELFRRHLAVPAENGPTEPTKGAAALEERAPGQEMAGGPPQAPLREDGPPVSDSYGSFAELAIGEAEGRDWVRLYLDRGSRFLVMAPHGGWIEPYTTELAQAIAGEDFSFYTFKGVKERGNRHLHLTSHRTASRLDLTR